MAKRQKRKTTTKKKNEEAKKTDTALISARQEKKEVGRKSRQSGGGWMKRALRAVGRILITILQTMLVGLPFLLLAISAMLFAIAKISLPPLVEALSSFEVQTLWRVVYEEVNKIWMMVGLGWLGLGLGLMVVFVIKKIQYYGR